MKRERKGFTLIEVALFLAITGVLFVGIVIGTGNSLYQQRFTDAVQSYTEFLRGIYSEVSNPQSVGEGRSERAIYGKLISFGQKYDLNGEENNEYTQKIFVYDVVGNVKTDSPSGKVVEMLEDLEANVVVEVKRADGTTELVEPAGIVETYVPRWDATIETTALNYIPFTGSILVVRHPRSGTINTLVYQGDDGIIQVNEVIRNANISYKTGGGYDVSGLLLDKIKVQNGFKVADVDFCVDMEGIERAGIETAVQRERRDIRLVANARNASGIELIDLNDYDESDDGIRNKCMPEAK